MNVRYLGLIPLLGIVLTFGCESKQKQSKQKSIDLVTTKTLGLAYLEENKLNEAEEQFQKLIEIAPDEAIGYANLGLVYMRMGEYALAEAQIKKALQIKPNDPDIRLNLAEICELDKRKEEAIEILEATIQNSPKHVKSLYELAEFYDQSDNRLKAKGLFEQLVEILPGNLAARLRFVETLLRNDQPHRARRHMEQLRKQAPELPKESIEFYEKALSLMRSNKAKEALPPAMIFHNFMKVTPAYQADIMELKSSSGPLMGTPILAFSRDISIQAQRGSILEALRFTDATVGAGLDVVKESHDQDDSEFGATLAVADYEGDGDQDIYFSQWEAKAHQSRQFLLTNEFGRFENTASEAGIGHSGQDLAALFADYDNDGYLDLYVVNRGKTLLYRNVALGKFKDVAATAGLADAADALAAVFADFDHDGDLDLFLANENQNQFYRNNLDSTFLDISEKSELAKSKTPSRDLAIGDFDEDGDLDLFVVNETASNLLYTNVRQGRFHDVTEEVGLKSEGNSSAVAAGDYNNDGFLDLFVAARDGKSHRLYNNKGDGSFEKDSHSKEMFAALQNFMGRDAKFFDFDNDGFLDLLVAGQRSGRTEKDRGLSLFHNDGTGVFDNVSHLLPEDIDAVSKIAVADYNEDGDMDIFLAESAGGIRLLRNDGGNANKYLKVKLVGLRTGSGKNNYFGIGSKLEVRAGDLYQMRVITEPVTHFGLGQRLKADVVRILWPNGVAQNLFYPGSDQDLVEEQTLKGSCAFLYAWNGQEYQFVTDVMWRSALGMPLGIMGGERTYGFPNSSQDYFKIPGELLKAQNGKYSLQITEELWETAYFDEVKLIAVDHPESIEIFVDERFVPPPIPPLDIFKVKEKRSPLYAVDERGNDLLQTILHKDNVYVSNLIPARYQGLTKVHDLILDLGDLSEQETVVLFLNGWIFPTDASINVAISQSNDVKVIPPYLQVKDRNGNWQTVLHNMSFPMGKNKTMVVNLSGKFLTNDFNVRIRTNMEIYWDHIFFSTEEPAISIQKTVLSPVSADLHYRGFSKPYRRGGRYGPHWFDYADVSTDQKWRDLIGNYTRYGDVLPLLLERDDMYVIVNAGDEISIDFDATSAPPLKPGWKRDFIIYTDGWIKDGDLNTAYGKTVEPLPFHGMTSYPYGPGESYPDDEEHLEYLEKYNTRTITTELFRQALSNR
ncbi:tetratricopeptide repeat protein [candidate division KSB1 bacterium]|nr:tetratricopeptide repeat protein [candidate division KSB1 bacterium]